MNIYETSLQALLSLAHRLRVLPRVTLLAQIVERARRLARHKPRTCEVVTKQGQIQTFDKGPTPPPWSGPLSSPQMHNMKLQNTPIFFQCMHRIAMAK